MKFLIIYDGNCNLCVSWVRLLEKIDRGNLFLYGPMQDRSILDQYGLTPEILAQGMILIDLENPDRCWQGSTAIEEVARHLPNGEFLIALYRQATPLKWLGDRTYAQIRDHRYQLFGSRTKTFVSTYAPPCSTCTVHP